MSPAPATGHQRIVGEIYRQISSFLPDEPCEVPVASFDLTLSSEAENDEPTVVQPDPAVTCRGDTITEPGIIGAPGGHGGSKSGLSRLSRPGSGVTRSLLSVVCSSGHIQVVPGTTLKKLIVRYSVPPIRNPFARKSRSVLLSREPVMWPADHGYRAFAINRHLLLGHDVPVERGGIAPSAGRDLVSVMRAGPGSFLVGVFCVYSTNDHTHASRARSRIEQHTFQE